MLRWTFLIFSSNRSFLLRKSTMEVSAKNLWLQILLNRWRDSCMRFWKRSQSTGVSLWLMNVSPDVFRIRQWRRHSPLHRPLPAPCRMHWELRRRWCRSHPRNNGSTSSSLTSGHQHQTSCSSNRVRVSCLSLCYSACLLVLGFSSIIVTYLKCNSLQENCSSMIPVVFTRDRSTSCSVGR